VTQRLTDMQITRVALVDKGANARVMAILKRDEEGSMTEVDVAGRTSAATWLQKAADWLLGKSAEPVEKAQTFAAVIAGQTLQDALDDAFWTLRDVLWSAIYATDDKGQSEPLETKRALVEQDLTEFKTYLLARMDDGITKRDASDATRDRQAVEAVVAKVGKKISGSRMERLTAAAEALISVLDEVNEAVASESADEAKEDTVEKADIVAAMTEALEPVTKRLEALEAAKPAAKVENTIVKVGEDAGDDDGPATLATIAEAVAKIADRVGALEKSEGVRKSMTGQDEGEPVKKRGMYAGVLD